MLLNQNIYLFSGAIQAQERYVAATHKLEENST
jgi:hypothetical protein